MLEEPDAKEFVQPETTKRRGTSRKPKGLNLKQIRTLKRLATASNVAEAGRLAGYGTPEATYRGLQRAYATAPEVLERIGVTRDQILGKIANLMMTAHKPGLYGTIPDNAVQLKAGIHLDKAFKVKDAQAEAVDQSEGRAVGRHSLSLVFTDKGAAREFVEAIAARRSADGLIDLDAQVDANLG